MHPSAIFLTIISGVAIATATPNNGAKSEKSPSKISAKAVEKARELILKNDRSGALKVLKEAHREILRDSPKHVRELAPMWLEMAEVFLSDKGQTQYSLAESVWITKPKEALDILQPLTKLEDGNLLVSRLAARAALRAQECVKAEALVQQAEAAYPLGPEIRLLRLQVQDCVNGTNASAPALKFPTDVEWGEFEGAVRMLTVKDAARRKDIKTARAALNAWETSIPIGGVLAAENPEFWYWRWKTSHEAVRDRSAARRYLQLCAEMTARRRKNFAMYPEFCLHTETVESNLKSSDKSGS